MGSSLLRNMFYELFFLTYRLLIVKFGDNFNASIAQQQFILKRTIGEVILSVLHTSISEEDFRILHCLLLFSSLSNSIFFPLSCVNPSRCSTGSATIKSCSYRVTRRSVWATNTPWTCRHSTTTLPWIPWWVEGTLWPAQEWGEGQHRRPPAVHRALWTCERWCEEGQAGCDSSRVLLCPPRLCSVVTSST